MDEARYAELLEHLKDCEVPLRDCPECRELEAHVGTMKYAELLADTMPDEE